MSIADHEGWIRFTGKHPSGSGQCEFKLPTKTALHLRTHGHERKFCEIFSIEPILKNPTVIFEGLERDEYGDALCYCGIPPVRHVSEETTGPTPKNMVFMVFMNKEFAIFEFRWEKMDVTLDGYPQNHETRFRKQTWPR